MASTMAEMCKLPALEWGINVLVHLLNMHPPLTQETKKCPVQTTQLRGPILQRGRSHQYTQDDHQASTD